MALIYGDSLSCRVCNLGHTHVRQKNGHTREMHTGCRVFGWFRHKDYTITFFDFARALECLSSICWFLFLCVFKNTQHTQRQRKVAQHTMLCAV